VHNGTVLLEVGAVLLTLAVLGRVAHRLQFPTIPLYLGTGLILGDGGLNLIREARSFIETGAAVGVVLLLFMLGIEFAPQELRSSLRSTSATGLIDLVLNAAPGLIVGYLLGWDWLAIALLGAITYVSSSGIIAKLLADLQRLGNRETPMILSVLVIEDLVMAVFLPIVGVVAAGGSLPLAIGIACATVVVLGVILAVAHRFSPLASRVVDTESSELLVITMFGLVLLVAGGAEQVKISGAVGAFLLGMILSGSVAERLRSLLAPLRDVFAALFFLSFGIAINVRDIVDVLPITGVLVVLGIFTKMATGWQGARSLGIGPAGRLRAAVALTPRGEFSILLAGLGAVSGVAADLQPIAAAYVLIAAVVGTMLVRFVGVRRPASTARSSRSVRTPS
jgi:CPA2 family monovalent cation:H+ antiporter-2